MSEHPIEGLMTTAMNSIQDMIDVNTIIGDPIETSNNIVIIPISKVSFGFVAGGSEFKGETIDEYKKVDKEEAIQYRLPFGGGAGAGVSIQAIAFLVITQETVKLMPVDHTSCIDKLLDYVPDLMEKVNNMINKCIQNKKEETEKVIQAIKKNEENSKIKKPENQKNISKEHIDNMENYEYEYNGMEDE